MGIDLDRLRAILTVREPALVFECDTLRIPSIFYFSALRSMYFVTGQTLFDGVADGMFFLPTY